MGSVAACSDDIQKPGALDELCGILKSKAVYAVSTWDMIRAGNTPPKGVESCQIQDEREALPVGF